MFSLLKKMPLAMALIVACTFGSTFLYMDQAVADNNGWRAAFKELRKNNRQEWKAFKATCPKVNRACRKGFVAKHSRAVPELDPNHLGAALLLVTGGVLVFTGKRKTLNSNRQ